MVSSTKGPDHRPGTGSDQGLFDNEISDDSTGNQSPEDLSEGSNDSQSNGVKGRKKSGGNRLRGTFRVLRSICSRSWLRRRS